MDRSEIQIGAVYHIEIAPNVGYVVKVLKLHSIFAMCKFGEVQRYEDKGEAVLSQYGSFSLTLFEDARLLKAAPPIDPDLPTVYQYPQGGE